MAQDEGMGRGGEGDGAVRVLFDQDADGHCGVVAAVMGMGIWGCEAEQAGMVRSSCFAAGVRKAANSVYGRFGEAVQTRVQLCSC